MMQNQITAQDVQPISILVQYLAQRVSKYIYNDLCQQKIDVNYVLTNHDLMIKNPEFQSLPENQIIMTTLVYHYFISEQLNNLFQLLEKSSNVEFLAVKCVAYLQINRVDLANKTLDGIKEIEEDSCLVTLCQVWISLFDPKVHASIYDTIIQDLNELSDKYGYTLKTYNILGLALMIKGENDKACQIFENAMQEHKIYDLPDNDPLLTPANNELASLIYNYIKCHCIQNSPNFMGSIGY